MSLIFECLKAKKQIFCEFFKINNNLEHKFEEKKSC
jgi:hypothetical protein